MQNVILLVNNLRQLVSLLFRQITQYVWVETQETVFIEAWHDSSLVGIVQKTCSSYDRQLLHLGLNVTL